MVTIKDRLTGEETVESYDKLVLSPGSAPIRPPLPGIELEGIFSVRTVDDAKNIKKWLNKDVSLSGLNEYSSIDAFSKPKRAVVIGGGFIGLEMVENFIRSWS